MTEEFDYIIVGAGASGCVVANRLTDDGGVSALIVDAGGPEPDPPMDETRAIGSAIDWNYHTEPEPFMNNRSISWPRGKVYGGSSTISSMQYLRGHRFDYDHWNYLGNRGWSYREVLPYFRKSEANRDFGDEFHGHGGPLSVESVADRSTLKESFLSAANTLGFAAGNHHDFNGAIQEGAGFYQKTYRNGRRQSVGAAFLAPVLDRPNLKTRPFSPARRLMWDGSRVSGIEYGSDAHATSVAYARREVIVSAGVVDSPKLLMLSGIGPADHLRPHGIEVKADVPGVGQNLQDHVSVALIYKPKDGIRYIQDRVGTAGLFFRSGREPSRASPDVQLFAIEVIPPAPMFGFPGPMYFYSVSLVRPYSRGTITLASANPGTPAVIRANYVQCQADLDALAAGVQLVRELTSAKPLARWLDFEVLPGRTCQTADQINGAIRQTASTGFHPAGTCKMGHDTMAVVDDQLRVCGVEGLRVVDASVMPTVVNANTIAACVMIGEKAADLIRKRQTVSIPSDAEPAMAPYAGARSAVVRIRERRGGAA